MILVSGCLLGENCKYNGGNNYEPEVAERFKSGEVVSVCPESFGELPIPRPPAEIKGGDGADVWTGQAKVVTEVGKEVTAQFIKGAQKTLELAQKHNCKLAVLKARSPSCGSQQIYDGSFSGQIKPGTGVTTALLVEQGIRVINEEETAEIGREAVEEIVGEEGVITPELTGGGEDFAIF